MEKKRLDAFLFEVLVHRLERIVDEAYYAVAHVSGSGPAVTCGDHQESIFNAKGEPVMIGSGILHWITSLSDAIKHMSQTYAGEIHEGRVLQHLQARRGDGSLAAEQAEHDRFSTDRNAEKRDSARRGTCVPVRRLWAEQPARIRRLCGF